MIVMIVIMIVMMIVMIVMMIVMIVMMGHLAGSAVTELHMTELDKLPGTASRLPC